MLFYFIPLSLASLYSHTAVNLKRCGSNPWSEVALAKSRQEEDGAGNESWCKAQGLSGGEW